MGSALLLGLRMSDESWRRFQRAIIGASVAFAASFPLIWFVQQNAFSNSVFSLNFVEVANLRPRATAIIVLDEASPELVGPVVKALERERVTVRTRTVQAAGGNTLNAMPAMLSGRRSDHPLPCGPGILCDEGGNLDFSALHSSRADVDVIGYYIPYCKIRGLRSCEEIPYWSDGRLFEAVYNLVCVHLLRHLQCETLVADIDARLLRGTLLAYLQSAEPNRGQWRSALRTQLDAAPFWRDGGVLFAHIPLPHLPARTPSNDLLLDYSENMVEAADLLSRFLDQMLRSFGDDFVLVVTSDHSLRLGSVCREARYSSDHHCEQRMPPNLGLVPFVVVSPYNVRFGSVDSNLGLLK